jgi:hypothetical protein
MYMRAIFYMYIVVTFEEETYKLHSRCTVYHSACCFLSIYSYSV